MAQIRRYACLPLALAVIGLGAVLPHQAVAQRAGHAPAPTFTLGLASGMLVPACSGCGAYRVRSNQTLLVSLDLPPARVPAVLTLRGLLFSGRGRRLGAVTLGAEGMLLGRWVRVGAGIGGGGCRDSVLAITPPNGGPRPGWAAALAPMVEVHATAAVPVLHHVELGPVVGYVTSLGGFSAFPVSSDRTLLYWGVELTAH